MEWREGREAKEGEGGGGGGGRSDLEEVGVDPFGERLLLHGDPFVFEHLDAFLFESRGGRHHTPWPWPSTRRRLSLSSRPQSALSGH